MNQYSSDPAQVRGVTSFYVAEEYGEQLAAQRIRPAQLEPAQPAATLTGPRPPAPNAHLLVNAVNNPSGIGFNVPLTTANANGGGYGVPSSIQPLGMHGVVEPSEEWKLLLERIQEAYRRGVKDCARSLEEAVKNALKESEMKRDEAYAKGFSEGFRSGFYEQDGMSPAHHSNPPSAAVHGTHTSTLRVTTDQSGHQNSSHARPQISPIRRHPDEQGRHATQISAPIRPSFANRMTQAAETQPPVRPSAPAPASGMSLPANALTSHLAGPRASQAAPDASQELANQISWQSYQAQMQRRA